MPLHNLCSGEGNLKMQVFDYHLTNKMLLTTHFIFAGNKKQHYEE